MSMFDNEIAAVNAMRKNEKMLGPGFADTLADSGDAIESATGIAALGHVLRIPKILTQAGAATVQENLEYLGDATEAAIMRVEKALDDNQSKIAEMSLRIESQEFRDAMASAFLQTVRTTQKEKLKRIALILANGIAENDVTPETIDDMTRAAVELSSWDVQILGDIDKLELDFLQWTPPQQGALFSIWQEYWNTFNERYPGRTTQSAGGALSRLASFGFIYPAQGTSLALSPVSSLYRISEEGKRFVKRIHDFFDE
ncbi:MAG TPA: hypothetical protein VGK36_13335 [Candidatus Angelobacter sp.]|jgi:uncharacterized protein YnzC (UPF0291/DUF896 family)